ncbi:MAG TPA: hypothetical protein H9805_08395 [Candidatus Janibacter merdipullorum]|nr:hypothetical protein [Candidatus Janibacter merdipullorum]
MSSPSTEVGPGFLAFVAFSFLAAALWLLMRGMFIRLRRINLAQRAEEQRAEQAAEGSAEEADDAASKAAGDGGAASGVGDGPEEGERRGDEV